MSHRQFIRMDLQYYLYVDIISPFEVYAIPLVFRISLQDKYVVVYIKCFTVNSVPYPVASACRSSVN